MKTAKSLWTPASEKRRHLVLVGGGHTHVQVLRDLIMHGAEPKWSRPNLDVTVIVDQPVAMYSGMVPGFVAGQYAQADLEIDVVPLSQLALAKVVLARATAINPHNRTVSVEGRSPIHYDLLTIDIGSTVVGLELPGVKNHALASRPITRLVQQTEAELRSAIALSRDSGRPANLVIVGGGAAGVELSFTMRQRVLDACGVAPQVTLVHAGNEILPGSPNALVRRVRKAAAQRDIKIEVNTRILGIQVEPTPNAETHDQPITKTLQLEDGSTLEADAVIWVAGAVPHSNFDPGSLPTNDAGFLSTRPTLQVVDHDTVFAVGDCATLLDNPTPKAGVYAVRQGPVLIDNLQRSIANRPLRPYKPQSDFLTLLNLGDGTAIGSKKQLAFEGRWVMKLKDRIDRKFMEKFQVLRDSASFTPEFSVIAEEMSNAEDAEEMVCGGCAAKLESSALSAALDRVKALQCNPPAEHPHSQEASEAPQPEAILGLDHSDDVAAWRTPSGDLVIRSVDAFSSFANDPWLVGRVAALNALSDLFAKGISPRFALALVGLPLDLSPTDAEETLFQILSGARHTFDEEGVELLGGHTTIGQELWVGFSIDGVEAASENRRSPAILRSSGLQAGDRLILTKSLGTGVLLYALMVGQLSGKHYKSLLEALVQSNRNAGKLALKMKASAATDVTGFGLAGHLVEMLEGSKPVLGASLDLPSVPALPGVHLALAADLRSTAHRANAFHKASINLEGPMEEDHLDLLFDPQTSGGLLVGIAPDRAEALITALQEHGYAQATIIGTVTPHVRGPLIHCGTPP